MAEVLDGGHLANETRIVRPQSVEEATLDALRRDIVRLVLAPGTRLRLEDLATRYGVSHTPMRQALRRLEAEGLVVSSPNRGSRVALLSPDDIEVVETVTGSVEAKLARMGAPLVTDDDIRRLHILLDQRNMAVKANDMDKLYEAVWTGRELVYQKANRPALSAFAQQWRPRRERYLRYLKELKPEATPTRLTFYDEFIHACERRDGEAAAAATLHSTEWPAEELRRILQ
jgi:DNA-binding GntR family transcriptional regulator